MNTPPTDPKSSAPLRFAFAGRVSSSGTDRGPVSRRPPALRQYMLIDLGLHPHPEKAAEGRRLMGLAPDPNTFWVVVRIFEMFLRGSGSRHRRGPHR
ncbi:hypothetical protein ACU686_10150 [Yinghuangia aomiensis]